MRIDFNEIDREHFIIKECLVGSEVVFLVYPKHVGVKFNQKNKIFRSSVWDKEGNLISAGLPKFTNWGENPENFPLPSSLVGCTAVEKVDGSALIVSKWKGNVIIRTRGTVDASALETGSEIELLKKKYPDIFTFIEDTHKYSYVYEWVSPQNRIVLQYPEPDLYLIGMIKNEDYSLATQEDLDFLAKEFGIKRPQTHVFQSIEDMLELVKNWKGKEGVCLYSNKDQVIHKVKADEYLVLHQFKENANIETVIDLFIEYGCPNFSDFQKKLLETFDYECAKMVLPFCSRVCDAYKEVVKIIDGMKRFLSEQVFILPTRKLQAVVVLQAYGKTERSGMVFTLLDGKPLTGQQVKKLVYQVLKND